MALSPLSYGPKIIEAAELNRSTANRNALPLRQTSIKVGVTGIEPASLLLPKQAEYHFPTPRYMLYSLNFPKSLSCDN